jgi:hypothetical protein
MALLFTFVLFGSSLIWTAFNVWSLAAALFAALVLLVRPLAFSIALLRTRLNRYDRLLISWFGPRGLSTLLLVLLPVFAGVEGGAQMFAICSLVVLLSVVVHGGTLMLVGRGKRGTSTPQAATALAPASAPAPTAGQPGTSPGEAAPLPLIPRPSKLEPTSADGGLGGRHQVDGGTGNGLSQGTPESGEQEPEHGESELPERDRVSVEQLRKLQQAGEPLVVADSRTDRSYDNSELEARGAVRIVPGAGGTAPGSIVDQAMQLGIPRDAWIVVFCA